MSEQPSIECKTDGPFVVKGLQDFRDAAGAPIPSKPVMALCRCGSSANKPFCDGTHAKVGFSGIKVGGGPPDRRDDYAGEGVTVHDNRGLCSHSGVCTDDLASVFKLKTEPWIDPSGAKAQAIIDVVKRCPSGALSYSVEGVAQRDRPNPPSIALRKDGPLEVKGGVKLSGEPWGEGASKEHYALCRCGDSKNKPFCDGSHHGAGFKG